MSDVDYAMLSSLKHTIFFHRQMTTPPSLQVSNIHTAGTEGPCPVLKTLVGMIITGWNDLIARPPTDEDTAKCPADRELQRHAGRQSGGASHCGPQGAHTEAVGGTSLHGLARISYSFFCKMYAHMTSTAAGSED